MHHCASLAIRHCAWLAVALCAVSPCAVAFCHVAVCAALRRCASCVLRRCASCVLLRGRFGRRLDVGLGAISDVVLSANLALFRALFARCFERHLCAISKAIPSVVSSAAGYRFARRLGTISWDRPATVFTAKAFKTSAPARSISKRPDFRFSHFAASRLAFAFRNLLRSSHCFAAFAFAACIRACFSQLGLHSLLSQLAFAACFRSLLFTAWHRP